MRLPFQSKTGLLAYAAAWMPLGAMLGFALGSAADLRWFESASVTVPLTGLLAVVCLLPGYMCRFLPLTKSPPWKLLASHLVTAMWMSAIVATLVPFLVQFLTRCFPTLAIRFRAAIPVLTGMVFLFYLMSIALHYLLQAVESSKQAEILAREAELRALKSQINPHFLFNSLNSISALTSLDPAKAREMCIRLSEFLRSSLRLGERTSVPFGEELALTSTYLDVEQVRFGARLRVTRDFEGACNTCEVPPLLLQPLVENAIKHGVASLVEGGEITMSARISNERLHFIIENRFDPDAPAQRKSGFGLMNVRKRLQARYGGAASLDIQVENPLYRVLLSVPYNGKKGMAVNEDARNTGG
ncbi:MAG TPA: histidine kinase [Bryobacteraceae bacterium]|nr:histidine kinase [Bryobacteraceae bacterium]